ncbi:MAG: hypothetical protein R2813_00475 [Flavobacteriales bacterium]
MESNMRPIISLFVVLLTTVASYSQGDDPLEFKVTNIGQSQTINCQSEPIEIGVRVFPEHQDYIYDWSNGEFTPSIVVKPNSTTVYSVQITNATLGFQATRAFVITVSNDPVIALEEHHTIASNICPGTPLVLSANYSGGYPPYTFQWDNGTFTRDITLFPRETESHSVTITDACGSSDFATIEIDVEPQAELFSPPSKSLSFSCLGSKIEISPNSIGEVSGGVGYGYKYTFSDWSNAGKSTTISAQDGASLEVFMTDACGIQKVNSQFTLSYVAPQIPIVDPITACAGEEINVCVNNDDLRLYYWDGQRMNLDYSFHVEPGLENMKLIYVDECGETSKYRQNHLVCKF